VKTNLEATSLPTTVSSVYLISILGAYYKDLAVNIFPPSGAIVNIKTVNNNTATVRNYGYLLSYAIKPVTFIEPTTKLQMYVYRYSTYAFGSNLASNVTYKSYERYDGDQNIDAIVSSSNPSKLFTNALLTQIGLNISIISLDTSDGNIDEYSYFDRVINPNNINLMSSTRKSIIITDDYLDYSDEATKKYIDEQLAKVSEIMTINNSATKQITKNAGIMSDVLNVRTFGTVSDNAPLFNDHMLINGVVKLDSNNNKTNNKTQLKRYLQLIPDKSSDPSIKELIDIAIDISPDYKYIRSIINTYYKTTGITPTLGKTKLIKSPDNIVFFKKNVKTLRFI
jgi:hypothetical protein